MILVVKRKLQHLMKIKYFFKKYVQNLYLRMITCHKKKGDEKWKMMDLMKNNCLTWFYNVTDKVEESYNRAIIKTIIYIYIFYISILYIN